MLEEYSKGKVLTIQTQRKHKVKKNKKDEGAEEEDGEFDADKPLDPMDGDDSMEEESEEEEFVERQFNFVSEISIFVDYAVISRYLYLIKDKDYKHNALLLQGVISMFKRITN
jgi:hypothetical protein